MRALPVELVCAQRYTVYFLLDQDRVVYIGQSRDFGNRISSHYREGIKQFSHVMAFLVPQDQIDYIEKSLIEVYRPKYNAAHNPDYVGLSDNSVDDDDDPPPLAA